jgi:two-component system, NarL family, sensor histidine kinase UhpB
VNRLQQDEIRYRTLIEQLPMTTYIRALDETGAMLYVSPQVTALLGVSAHEWLANPDLRRSMIHVDDRERVILEEQRQFARDRRFHSEYRMQTPDGRTLWIADECIVVEDGPTHQLVAHGFLADISQRRQAEEALESLQGFSDRSSQSSSSA